MPFYHKIPHIIPGDPDERVCPACGCGFKTAKGMLSHLGQAKSCRWYRKGNNRDLSAYSEPQIIQAAAQTNVAQQGSSQDGEGGIDEDAPDFDNIMERHNLFELVPPGDEPDLHGASSSAGPSIP